MKFLLFACIVGAVVCGLNAEEDVQKSPDLVDLLMKSGSDLAATRNARQNLQAPPPQPQFRGSYGPAPSSYGSQQGGGSAGPAYPGAASSYNYQSSFVPQSCGQNLLFSCSPQVAPVPCVPSGNSGHFAQGSSGHFASSGPVAPQGSYGGGSSSSSYKDASSNFGTIDF